MEAWGGGQVGHSGAHSNLPARSSPSPTPGGEQRPPQLLAITGDPGPQPSHSLFTQAQERPLRDHKPSSGQRSAQGSGHRPASSHG